MIHCNVWRAPGAALILTLVLLPGRSDAIEPGCPGSSNPDPAILHCDDFDGGLPVSQTWNAYNSAGDSFVPAAGVGVGDSSAMRTRFEAGQVSSGAFSIGLGRLPDYYLGAGENWKHVVSPETRFREIYWREYVRFEAGWRGIAFKHSRVRVLDDPEPDDPGPHRSAFQGHFWPDTNPRNAFSDGVLFFNNTSGVDENGNVTDRGNNTETSVWLPRTPGRTIIFKDRPEGSEWLCIEAHIRLNDPGQANGIEEFWLDGELEARRTDQNHVGTYTRYGLNQLAFDNYWNGGSPQRNILYRDNMVVSTKRIGCQPEAPEPPPARPNPPILLP
jgi:hypothetical protein